MTSLESMLATYGIFAVVVGTFFEGETILVLAGLAAHRGYLPLPAVIAAGFFGTLLGDQLYFYIGRRHGEGVLAKRPSWRARATRAQNFLERHHVVFILGFRILYGLRTISPFAIGMSDVPLRRFFFLDAMSGIVWSTAVVLFGYSVGEGAEVLLGKAKEIEIWLFVGLTVAGIGVWLGHFMQRRNTQG